MLFLRIPSPALKANFHSRLLSSSARYKTRSHRLSCCLRTVAIFRHLSLLACFERLTGGGPHSFYGPDAANQDLTRGPQAIAALIKETGKTHQVIEKGRQAAEAVGLEPAEYEDVQPAWIKLSEPNRRVPEVTRTRKVDWGKLGYTDGPNGRPSAPEEVTEVVEHAYMVYGRKALDLAKPRYNKGIRLPGAFDTEGTIIVSQGA
jgi:hypothetical protein